MYIECQQINDDQTTTTTKQTQKKQNAPNYLRKTSITGQKIRKEPWGRQAYEEQKHLEQ